MSPTPVEPKLRLKPRRIYVDEKQWRFLKSHVAKEGTNVSEWMRNRIKEILPVLVVILTGYFLFKNMLQPELIIVKSIGKSIANIVAE